MTLLFASSRSFSRSLVFSAALLGNAPFVHSQGCAQCRDNAAAAPASTQRAYRHAIALLTLAAGGIFVGTVALLRRNR